MPSRYLMNSFGSFSFSNQKIKPLEYKRVVNHLIKLGFNNVFTQGFESAETIYTPNFADKKSDFKF